MKRRAKTPKGIRRQTGAAIMVLLMILGVMAAYMGVSALSGASQRSNKDKVTANALMQAKAALIAAAVGDITRPGNLPCPDTNDDGNADGPCNIQTLANNQRLGRFPWRTLGLEDLRDSDGERLWYAVSTNFKNNPAIGQLNSDALGTITLRNPTGVVNVVINDGTNPAVLPAGVAEGVVAVIISPGTGLTRQDGVAQNRAIAPPAVRNNPINYLDNANAEDNANFLDSNANGFISGPIRNAANNVILNDRLLAITVGELMPLLERRVTREALNCLNRFATAAFNGQNSWAAPLDINNPPNYVAVPGARFGRIPDAVFAFPVTAACSINTGAATWWTLWREMVFYAVSTAFQPGGGGNCALAACLTVNPPTIAADKQFVIFASGRRLAGQNRNGNNNNNTGTITNYLEGQNSTTADDSFTQQNPGNAPPFNDSVIFQ